MVTTMPRSAIPGKSQPGVCGSIDLANLQPVVCPWGYQAPGPKEPNGKTWFGSVENAARAKSKGSSPMRPPWILVACRESQSCQGGRSSGIQRGDPGAAIAPSAPRSEMYEK